MSRRNSRNSHRRSRQQVLEVRVMSPRIAWLGFLKCMGVIAKLAFILALVAGLGWGIWQGIQRAFYHNPDFRLQVIELNPNSAIDEAGVAEIAAIDLTANLFDIDVEQVAARLKARPEISAAHAERHLPGKLSVRVTARSPRAWIAAAGVSTTRQVGGMLVDTDHIAYPCPPLQLESAQNLPLIELPVSDKTPLTPGQKISQPELAHCLRLLDSAAEADAQSVRWIDSIRQVNAWSLLLTTRQGTAATFGLGDHERQMESLRTAMDHSAQKGYTIGTINLIPKFNIPITLRTTAPAPRAIPVAEPSSHDRREDRRAQDLSNLLNRN